MGWKDDEAMGMSGVEVCLREVRFAVDLVLILVLLFRMSLVVVVERDWSVEDIGACLVWFWVAHWCVTDVDA